METISSRVEQWLEFKSQVKDKRTMAYLNLLNALRADYEALGRDCEKECMEVCREIQNFCSTTKLTDEEIPKIMLASYDTAARLGDFRAYCIALEWKRPIEKQFFLPRKRILEKHGLIQAFQDVADDKLDFLFISMPPRSGKSTMSLYFLSMMAGMRPDRSILGNGHSTALTQSFYSEMMNIMTSDEYRFGEIFPNVRIVKNSAEYSWIDLGNEKRFHTLMFKSVDGGTTGLAECSNVLYCDDLIKDIETANNPDRLDKIFATYTSTIQDRKVQRLCKDGEYRPAPEIHVATRWSLRDPIGRLLGIYGEEFSDRIRIINIPCYDENGESNFEYDFGKGFDKSYYHQLELSEDPVVFAAKYFGQPVERDGRPFTRDQLTFFNSLPEDEPDWIVAYADVAHGGEDYFAMPIGYVFGSEVYIEDVLFVNRLDTTSTRPLVCDKLMQHHVSRAGFEENNGGKLYADWIVSDLKRRQYRCNITTHKVPTTKSKLDRIMACQSEIKGIATENGTYRIYFKSDKAIGDNKQYVDFLRIMYQWSQKPGAIQRTQHDDNLDAIAGLITNILGGRGNVGRASSKISLDKYGI